jgi:hypothetical protein
MTITVSGTSITFPDATTQTTAATANPIPATTVMLFYQAAAPTGWTQVTSLNDYDLRLVSGTGGGTGGTTAYSTVFANQTPTISGSASATTLSLAQIPSHDHSGAAGGNGGASVPVTYGNYQVTGDPSGYNSGTANVYSNGSGSSHTHGLSATSSAITLNVRYANIIICSKN